MHNTVFFPDCFLLSAIDGSIWIPYLARYSEIFKKPNARRNGQHKYFACAGLRLGAGAFAKYVLAFAIAAIRLHLRLLMLLQLQLLIDSLIDRNFKRYFC